MNARLREALFARARGRCEARYPSTISNVDGVRCVSTPTDAHHVLPRSRGGRVLDARAAQALKDGTFDPARDLAHLIALCSSCHHGVAHGQPERAHELRLTVRGHARTHKLSGQPVYVGDDLLLAELWPPQEVAV